MTREELESVSVTNAIDILVERFYILRKKGKSDTNEAEDILTKINNASSDNKLIWNGHGDYWKIYAEVNNIMMEK